MLRVLADKIKKHLGAGRHHAARRQRGIHGVAGKNPVRQHMHERTAGQMGARQQPRHHGNAHAVHRGAQQHACADGLQHHRHLHLLRRARALHGPQPQPLRDAAPGANQLA